MLAESVRRLPRYKLCFVCGRENRAGLDIQFYRGSQGVFCEWTPEERHLGYPDRVHGGVTASILDEAMGWAPAADFKRLCYSIDIAVKYRRPIAPGGTFRVEAKSLAARSRLARTEGRILDAEGVVHATATGLYMPLPEGRTEEMLSHLYVDGVERVLTVSDL